MKNTVKIVAMMLKVDKKGDAYAVSEGGDEPRSRASWTFPRFREGLRDFHRD